MQNDKHYFNRHVEIYRGILVKGLTDFSWVAKETLINDLTFKPNS